MALSNFETLVSRKNTELLNTAVRGLCLGDDFYTALNFKLG